jgi:hypothetical protein
VSRGPGSAAAGPSGPLVRFLVAAILILVVVFPPETRGEAAAGCAVLVLLLAALAWREAGAIGPTAAAALAAGWALSLPAATPAAAVEPVAVAAVAWIAGGVAAGRARDLVHGRVVPGSIAAAAVVVSIHALAQWGGGLEATVAALDDALVPDRDLVIARLREGRSFAAFPTPAALGGFLAIAIPVTLGLAAEARGRSRVWAGGALAVQAAGLAVTASGTAVAALAGGGLVALLRSGRARARWTIALAAGLVVLAAGVVAVRGTSVLDPTDPAGPWRLRAGNVQIALRMAADHPWVGVGPGGYGESFPAYRREGDGESRHAHCLPAEFVAETGLVLGTGLSALFFIVFLGPAWVGTARRPAWETGAAAGLAAFAIHNLMDFTAFLPSILWSAALLRGALAGPRCTAGAASPRFGPRHGVAVACAAAAVAITSLSGLGWNALVASRNAAAMGRLDAAEGLADRSATLVPWDADARILQAEVRWRRGDLEGALAAADAAVARAPMRPSARALRARLRLERGDAPGAFADLAEAARMHPARAEYARGRDDVRDAISKALP